MTPVSHILWSHVWLGISTDAFDRARAFVRAAAKRKPGEPLPAAIRLSELMSELSLLRAEVSLALREFCDTSEEDRAELSEMATILRFNNLKIAASEQAPQVCQGALGVCGIVGYKNDTPFSVGRHLRDTMSACLMVANERIHKTDAEPAANRQGRLGMAEFRPGTPDQAEFLAELLDAGLLIDSGVSGVYGRGEGFERVRWAFDALVTEAAEVDGPERLAFPPLLPRRQLEEIGYLKSFPHLAGSIFSFEGDEEQAAEQEERASRHEDWSEHQEMTDLVLTPPPATRSTRRSRPAASSPPGGITVDAGGSYVFRHEPSGDPARLQMFHQREIVRIGEPETVAEWRDAWRDRAVGAAALGRPRRRASMSPAIPSSAAAAACSPRSQRGQELKFEILVQIAGPEPTAVASFNYHQDHFSSTYGIEMEATGGPPIPPASASAWSGSPLPCCASTASTSTRGRPRSGRSCGSHERGERRH